MEVEIRKEALDLGLHPKLGELQGPARNPQPSTAAFS